MSSGDGPAQGRHLQPVDVGSGQMAPFDPYQAAFEDEDAIDLREYWRMLVKRKWVVISFLIIVTVAALLSTLLMVPEYRSTATVQVSPDSARIFGYEDFAAEPRAGAKEFYATQYDILRSRSLAEGIIKSRDLVSHPELTGEASQRGLVAEFRNLGGIVFGSGGGSADSARNERQRLRTAVRNFRSKVEISPVQNSQLVKVGFVSFDPEFAREMANALVDEYTQSTMQRRYDAGADAREFLESQLDEMRVALERSDQALMDFAEENQIANLDERRDMAAEGLRQLNSRLNDVNADLLNLEAWRDQIRTGEIQYLEPVQSDEQIRELQAELAAVNTEYASLSERFMEGYPTMVELRERIDRLRQELDERRQAIAANILSRYNTLLNRQERLEQAIEDREQAIMDLNQRSVQYNILQREYETNNELYDGLLQRMKEIGVAAGAQENNIAVIDPAVAPASPFKPNLPLNMALALVLGLFGGCGLAILLEYLDRTVRATEELEQLMGRPMLGLVPLVKVREKRKSDRGLKQPERAVGHYSARYPSSSVSEAFRSLRTSLMFSSIGGMPATLLMTSPGPGDGKTTAAINLATVLAQNGERVLLIDADLRKPRLHRDFGMPREPGLTNRIARLHAEGGKDPSVIQRTDVENLFFMPSGTHTPNPAEMLGSPRMTEILGKYVKVFDRIVIDTAPVLGLADSLVMSKQVDGVLMVVAAGNTGKDSVKAAMKRMNQVGAPVLGGVLNAVDLESPDYSYYSSYYYNYEDDDGAAGRKGLLTANDG